MLVNVHDYKKVIVKQPKATPLKLTILIHYNYNQDIAWYIIITYVVGVHTVENASLPLCRLYSSRRGAHAYKRSMLHTSTRRQPRRLDRNVGHELLSVTRAELSDPPRLTSVH